MSEPVAMGPKGLRPKWTKPHPSKGKPRSPEALANLRAAKAKLVKPLAARYWAMVDKRGPDECWPWLGNKNPHGYGQIWPGAERAKRRADTMFAHHVATELAGIEVPPGMVRDHICKDRGCQNPAHIRIVTQAVNTTENSNCPHGINSRKTHCTKCQNPLSGANLAVTPTKKGSRKARNCLTCNPRTWMWAVIEREPPANAKPWTKWRGPFNPEAK